MDTIDTNDDEPVKIDDNVDELFEQKMKMLRELGLYDDRMMDKVNLIKEMEANPTKPVPKGHLKRNYVPLGRVEHRPEDLIDFRGEDKKVDDPDGFNPFASSGLKWQMPISKRRRSPSPTPSSHNPSDLSSSSDYKQTEGIEPTNFHKFFDNKKKIKVIEEKKTETITDIEAFIKNCNKKAEKPKPLMDDIDDFIKRYTQKLNKISAHFAKS